MNGRSDVVIISIRSSHAECIYAGKKRVELRKSFPECARIVFLYETAPIAAVTGAFTVQEAVRVPVERALALAAEGGVTASAAQDYYGNRQHGWVVRIGAAIKFRRPVSLGELQTCNHYLRAPQAFAYLHRFEGSSRRLLSALGTEARTKLSLSTLSPSLVPLFADSIRLAVGAAYEDIDTDFIEQLLDVDRAQRGAFSTRRKHVLTISWNKLPVGFTVLTEKVHGAWKSGPTVLFEEFRGLGLGRLVRGKIEDYCRSRGAWKLYCTCPSNDPRVLAYLMASGMKMEASLAEHLCRGRDELVLVRRLSNSRGPSVRRARARKRKFAITGVRVSRVGSAEFLGKIGVAFFCRMLPGWYFSPPNSLRTGILGTMADLERGESKYSAKGRMLFVCVAGSGRPMAAILCTVKRSQMLKLNIVSAVDHLGIFRKLLKTVLKDTTDFRRLYVTVPEHALHLRHVLSETGFSFEGVLRDAFGNGVNHVCFGMVRDPYPSTTAQAERCSVVTH